MFSLKYYLKGCPSWRWHYKFRMSPLISDIKEYLDKEIGNMNEFKFNLGKPYKPFQQLMLILPPQMNTLLPVPFQKIMTDDKLLCTQFYPTEARLDVAVGFKTMTSESILPEINEELLMETIDKFESKLNLSEVERNTIRDKPFMC